MVKLKNLNIKKKNLWIYAITMTLIGTIISSDVKQSNGEEVIKENSKVSFETKMNEPMKLSYITEENDSNNWKTLKNIEIYKVELKACSVVHDDRTSGGIIYSISSDNGETYGEYWEPVEPIVIGNTIIEYQHITNSQYQTTEKPFADQTHPNCELKVRLSPILTKTK